MANQTSAFGQWMPWKSSRFRTSWRSRLLMLLLLLLLLQVRTCNLRFVECRVMANIYYMNKCVKTFSLHRLQLGMSSVCNAVALTLTTHVRSRFAHRHQRKWRWRHHQQRQWQWSFGEPQQRDIRCGCNQRLTVRMDVVMHSRQCTWRQPFYAACTSYSFDRLLKCYSTPILQAISATTAKAVTVMVTAPLQLATLVPQVRQCFSSLTGWRAGVLACLLACLKSQDGRQGCNCSSPTSNICLLHVGRHAY